MVDLDSRLTSQRASVDRVRALLAQAKDLGEIVRIEGELTRRTADLESLEARLAALTARVDLSTIELRLIGEGVTAGAAGAPGFRDGLDAGWQVLAGLGRAASVAAGVLVPFSPLLAVGALVLWRARARGARVPTPPPGAAA